MPPLQPTRLVLRPSRMKHLLFLLLSCTSSVVGVWMVLDDQGSKGWFVLVVFGVCAAVFGVQLLPGASWLELTVDGFCFCSLFRKSAFIPWTSVTPFAVAPVADNTVVVFSSERGSKSRFARINVAITGATEALPDTYGHSPESLAALLNEWRDLAVQTSL